MKVPRHVAIILDGNRRYAKQHNFSPNKGHELGAKNVENLIKWAQELGIKELTLYIFSTENFNRTKKEVTHLMNLFLKWFKNLKINKDVQINFIGKLSLLPKKVQDVAKKLMKETRNNKIFKINFAMAYGSRLEVVEAAKKFAKMVKNSKTKLSNLTTESFKKYLWLGSEPDLIIRTSGEKRLSNFLLWQAAYSELYFTKKYWPEFSKQDLIKAIKDYNKRKKRYGR